MTRPDWKRFTKFDWYGLCGAERFADGSEPFIAALRVDDGEDELEALAIFDAQGFHVHVRDVELMWLDVDAAARLFATMPVRVSMDALDALEPTHRA